jgi:hypothetical protein
MISITYSTLNYSNTNFINLMTKLVNWLSSCKTGMTMILLPDQPDKLASKMGIREDKRYCNILEKKIIRSINKKI